MLTCRTLNLPEGRTPEQPGFIKPIAACGRKLVMNRVGFRHLEHTIPARTRAVGVSNSSTRRETITAAEKALEKPTARRFEDVDGSLICIDGMVLGKPLGAQSYSGCET